jgi:hypothetical protein
MRLSMKNQKNYHIFYLCSHLTVIATNVSGKCVPFLAFD